MKFRWNAFISWLIITISEADCFRPPRLQDELGCSPTLGTIFRQRIYFDPLKIATDANFALLRERELKHGRVAMLAILETMLTPILRQSTGFLPEDYPESLLIKVQSLRVDQVLPVVVTCGLIETLFLVQLPDSLPGDYGTGYGLVRDKGLNERRLEAELENGRLAMLALLFQLATEVATGGLSWEQQWRGLIESWVKAGVL